MRGETRVRHRAKEYFARDGAGLRVTLERQCSGRPLGFLIVAAPRCSLPARGALPVTAPAVPDEDEPMPITDTGRALLRAAMLRDDGLLPRPDRLAGAALLRVAASLIDTRLAEPVPVHPEQPRWRDIAGAPTALRITEAGCAAGDREQTPSNGSGGREEVMPVDDQRRPNQEPADEAQVGPAPARPPRPGSKAAQLLAMLSRAEGASIDALSAALAWQPHTVRAALTRLRQRGLTLSADRTARPTMYRIAPAKASVHAPADSGEVG